MIKVTFTLPTAALGNATDAILLGDFNNWNPDEAVVLTLQPGNILQAEILLEPGMTYEYRFLLSDGTWVNDWAAEQYVFKPELNVENSVVTVPAKVPQKKNKAAAPKKAPAKKAAPKKTAKNPVKDDLTKIEGIGPKIMHLLEAEGITDFKSLGKSTAKKLKSILDAAGNKFQMHQPASWPKQAKLAAAGKWDELKKLQQELKGGK